MRSSDGGKTLVCLLALAGAALAILAQAGRWSDRFDAINIFLPYWTVPALLIAALVLVLERHARGWRWWAGWLAMLALAAGPLPWLVHEAIAGPGAPCSGERLRIVQFNAWKDNRATPAAARWIRAADPDLVLLEEAHAALPLPALLHDLYPYQQSCVGPSFCSTTILARTPPLAAGGLARADPENRGALSAAWMRIDGAAGPFTVVAVHLGRPWPFARFAGDRAQLVDFVRSQPAATTIVAGDFNLPGWTFQLRRLEAAMGLARRSHGLRSWPAVIGGRRLTGPLLPIDQLFAGNRWSVAAIARGPFLGSDHYPLLVDLRRCATRAS